MALLVTQVGQADLVARTLLGQDALKLTELGDFLSIDSGDDITFLQTGSLCSTVFDNLCHIDTFHRAEIHFLVFLLLGIHKVLDVGTLNTDHGALYVTKLLEVIYHLVHNGGGDGEAVADV